LFRNHPASGLCLRGRLKILSKRLRSVSVSTHDETLQA